MSHNIVAEKALLIRYVTGDLEKVLVLMNGKSVLMGKM